MKSEQSHSYKPPPQLANRPPPANKLDRRPSQQKYEFFFKIVFINSQRDSAYQTSGLWTDYIELMCKQYECSCAQLESTRVGDTFWWFQHNPWQQRNCSGFTHFFPIEHLGISWLSFYFVSTSIQHCRLGLYSHSLRSGCEFADTRSK